MCKSVPQIEATFTLTSTSLRPTTGIFTSRTSEPGAASGFTTASIVDGMKIPYEFGPKHKTFNSSTEGKASCLSRWLERFRHDLFVILRLAPGNAERLPFA